MTKHAIVLSAVLLALASTLSYAQAPVPLINHPLIPDAIVPGGPQFTLTINGTGFVSNSTVNWNGSPLATQFVSASQLTATVPAANISKPGSAEITVVSPGPGGGTSNAIAFEVARPLVVGTFNSSEYPAGSEADSVAVGDFNGDGNLDIAVASLDQGTVSVYLGDGHGAFQYRGDYSAGSDSVVVGDFNGDGKLDLAVRGGSVLLGNGDGTFQPPIPFSGGDQGLAVGDFNGDGKLDLASSDYSGVIYILLGNGDGTFQAPVAYNAGSSPWGIAVGDFNGDGKLDLATSLSGETVGILLGNGDGTFQPVVTYPVGNGSTLWEIYTADLNGDGILDLVEPVQQGMAVLLGNGDGTFRPYVYYPVPGSNEGRGGVADVNGDGIQDLILTSGWSSGDSLYVLLGNGDGTFQKPRTFTIGGTAPFGIAFGDFNKDGILDIAAADMDSSQVSVELGAVVALDPDALYFGTVGVGKQASLTSKLTNIRKVPLNIKNISITGNGAFKQTNNCGASIGAGQSCLINVTFTPTKSGYFTAAVRIDDNAPGTPQLIFLLGKGSSSLGKQ